MSFGIILCMIDESKWTPQELEVFAAYGYRCVLCGFQYADTLHHEPPRSLNPNWEVEPWTQYPLCEAHHEHVHSISRDLAQMMLDHHVDIYAPGAVDHIKLIHAGMEKEK